MQQRTCHWLRFVLLPSPHASTLNASTDHFRDTVNFFPPIVLSTLVALIGFGHPHPDGRNNPGLPVPARVSANDNRRPAGTLRDGRLELKLDIVTAQWFPEADSGPSVMVQAFAEDGRAPEIPGPAIRIPEGAEIHVALHNSLDVEAVVHGLHTRPATTDDVVKVPAG